MITERGDTMTHDISVKSRAHCLSLSIRPAGELASELNKKQHRDQEFLSFSDTIEKQRPNGLDRLSIVYNNMLRTSMKSSKS
jgi:hypothetical protein